MVLLCFAVPETRSLDRQNPLRSRGLACQGPLFAYVPAGRPIFPTGSPAPLLATDGVKSLVASRFRMVPKEEVDVSGFMFVSNKSTVIKLTVAMIGVNEEIYSE